MKRPIPLDTKERQARASHPHSSAWVSANAGSGKTHVLAQRVVRLLLEGAPPSKILCLTFTKAAAANMAQRVFSTLSGWTRLNDPALSAAIEATGADRPDSATLLRARRLFARTVETPGGLKIQTIHAFCERLLHLFPFEANVPAGFEVLAEEEQQELLGKAREQAFGEAIRSTRESDQKTLGALAVETSEFGLDSLVGEALSHRTAIRKMIRDHQGPAEWGKTLGVRLGLAGGATLADIERAIVEGGIAEAEWEGLARIVEHGSVSDKELAQRLREAFADSHAKADSYLRVFLTKDEKPRAKMVAAALKKLAPGLLERLEAERDRLHTLVKQRRAARCVDRSVALFSIVERILEDYAHQKAQRGKLDFDDLIERTRTLLERSNAAWVLYKLDSGIDHILVDEAQDTSPDQWTILQKIAEDFLAGAGARQLVRTFFAVGDEKQSIYSFQGAAPHMFDEMRKSFAEKHRRADLAFEQGRLHLSFRSVTTVLDSVDRVFDWPEISRGLVADGEKWPLHEALKKDLPGLVEIWNPVASVTADESADWELPLDQARSSDPAVVVASRIASLVKSWLSPRSTEAVFDDGANVARHISPGDVLVLVRSRGAVFDAVIRALKQEGVPVAGADRLVLTQHIAVEDLIAAGRASLAPDDDLTLACLLKSPLVGLDDDDLLHIAPRRKGSLLQALEASAEARHREAAERLKSWRKRARSLTPFGFYSELLGRDGGRRSLLARLGPEAGDVIDEFVKLALQHERSEAPSLSLFLHKIAKADTPIKRDMEAAGGAVRVMTVHAAKGLEAKIVFLPDTFGTMSGKHDPKLFDVGEDERACFAWARGASGDPDAIADARGRSRSAEEAEQRRLLYVAMTRAEERLYIAGFHGPRPPKTHWYGTVRAGLEPHCTSAPAPWAADETVLRHGASLQISTLAAPATALTEEALPDWLTRSAPFEAPPSPPVSPSTALAAADQLWPSATSEANGAGGFAAGRAMHALLQYLPDLPPERRAEAAARYLTAKASELLEGVRDALARDALILIDAPEVADLFGPGSRTEVAVAGRLERQGRKPVEVAGQIDRIAVTPKEVLVGDFKTGRSRPADETPSTYVTQLALYRAVLQPLYPGRLIRTLLIWTGGPAVVELDAARLDAALAQAISDAPGR